MLKIAHDCWRLEICSNANGTITADPSEFSVHMFVIVINLITNTVKMGSLLGV